MISVNTPSEPLGTNFIKDIKNWLSTCPAFTKTLYYIIAILIIPNFLFGTGYLMVNSPYKVVESFQIYRLVLSPFAFWGIVEPIFCLFAYLPVSAKLEKEWGTTRTAVDFFLKNLVINVSWVILQFVLEKWGPACYGLFPSLFALLMRDLANPEEVKSFMCLPVHIKARYYPAALWILVSILTGLPRFDCLVAMLIGYVFLKCWNKSYYSFLNTRRMVAWTETCFFSRFKKSPNYVGVTDLPIEIGEPERSSKISDRITDVSSDEYQAPLFQTQFEQIPEDENEDAKIQIAPEEQDVPETHMKSHEEENNKDAEINITPEEEDVPESNITPEEQVEEVNKIEENVEEPVEKTEDQ